MKLKDKNRNYPIRSIRLSQKTWEAFKEKRWKSRKGWEQFIKKLISSAKE